MLYFCYLCTWWAILLPGLVLFSSCYTVMGLTLGIADLQSGALDFFSFCCSLMLSISMNLRVIYWVFWVSLFAFLFSICILGFVKILENIVPIKIFRKYDCKKCGINLLYFFLSLVDCGIFISLIMSIACIWFVQWVAKMRCGYRCFWYKFCWCKNSCCDESCCCSVAVAVAVAVLWVVYCVLQLLVVYCVLQLLVI